MERKTKSIFQLETPYTTFQWPKMALEDEGTILDLLCSLLSPIGRYRADHIVPSKGKRLKKRKRKEAAHSGEIPASQAIPQLPEIVAFTVVGLSNVTRKLESAAQSSKSLTSSTEAGYVSVCARDVAAIPPTLDRKETTDLPEKFDDHQEAAGRSFFAIFVSNTPQSSILHAHLPQLILSACIANPDTPATRLVPMSRPYEERICTSLGIPRVSSIGILNGAPHSAALAAFITETVPPIDIPWIREAMAGVYKPVKVNVIQTTAPAEKAKVEPAAGIV